MDGKTYTKDVIVLPGRVFSPWWRKEGHSLRPGDLDEALKARIRTLVVGTGASGVMQVPQETLEALRAEGVTLHVMRTGEAVDFFNRISEEDSATAAALHLTC